MTTINFDTLVALIKDRGMPAQIEQTGGGCATIYVGTPGADGLFQAVAGPGWFEGPGWTNGRGTFEEFCWGLDDFGGETDPHYERTPRPLADIADDIVALARQVSNA
jgi:hypothetical protein